MSDNQFHKQFSEGDELPVNIPNADYAWSDMLGKLDTGMPEAAGVATASKSLRNLWKWFAGLALLSFVSWVVLTQLPAKNDKNITSSTNTAKESNSSNNNSVNGESNNSSDSNNQSDNKTAESNSNVAGNREADVQSRSANAAEKPISEQSISNADQKTALSDNSNSKVNKESNTTGKAIDDTHSTTTNETAKRNNSLVKEDKAITGKGDKKDVVVVAGKVTKKKSNSGKAGRSNTDEDFLTGRKLANSSKEKNGTSSLSKQTTEKKTNAIKENEKAAIDLRNTFVNADNSDAAIVNHKLPSTLPDDPTAGSPLRQTVPASPAKARINIQGGLQWNFQSPSGGNGTYFYNEKGKSEPLRAFYPGAWLSFQHNKSLYTIEVSPFFTTALPAKPYSSETMRYTIGDTNFTNTESRTLRKLFGISAAIGYAHNITGNWWAGGSLRSNWWQKGAATSTIDLLKQSDSGTFTDIKSTSSRTLFLNDSSWSAFSKMQFVMNADIFYRRNAWQAGLQVGLPINALTKRNGPRNPLYAAIVLRLAIPPRNGKR